MRNTYEETKASQERGAEAFVNFFVHYCLHNLFKSKREMSLVLGIGYQTILLVTNKPEKYKGASLVFQELVMYCISRGISMDEIVQVFLRENNSVILKPKYVLQEPGYYMQCPLFQGNNVVEVPEGADFLFGEAYRFILRLRVIYCKGCMCFWNEEDNQACLLHQTMLYFVRKLQP